MDYLASFHSAVEEQWDFVLDWFSNNEKVVFTVGEKVVFLVVVMSSTKYYFFYPFCHCFIFLSDFECWCKGTSWTLENTQNSGNRLFSLNVDSDVFCQLVNFA